MRVTSRLFLLLGAMAFFANGLGGCDCNADDDPDSSMGDSGADAFSDATDDAADAADGDDASDADDGGESMCGDGAIQGGEECDDGNDSDDDFCLTTCRSACGDGVVNSVERCDIAIAAGEPGSCPISCEDGAACTSTVLSGSGCAAECLVAPITSCNDGDGCCAPGCDAFSDDDCEPMCGNSVVEPGETCEDGVGAGCASCDDGEVCTADVTRGSAAMCNVMCTSTPIEACTNADGCCAAGCDAGSDDDCPIMCGNGIVEPGELCDGDCPTVASCDDGIACTNDVRVGTRRNCDARCTNLPIMVCEDDDGCCARGCDQTNDNDCAPRCGNDVVERGETCDGACPLACDDGSVCTTDRLIGNAAICTAVCDYADITSCRNGDGCCPLRCTPATDNDCSATCGNGVLDPGEICDFGTASPCPRSCDDGDPCTTDTRTGSVANCSAQCVHTPVTTCTGRDGCCPTGCNAATDNDCSSSCGNGTVEPGETCDGTCPTTCDDMDACTMDIQTGSATRCNVECANRAITRCTSGDGCCPAGCDATRDRDCMSSCGNGTVEPGETCDGDCPTSCNDRDPCTNDTLSGSADRCDARCTNSPITSCGDGDRCCPSGCSAATDDDCSARCGNGILEPGEDCDDGNTDPDDGCDRCMEVTEPTAFRITDLDLRDPHAFADIIRCSDITETVLGTPGLNPQIQTAMETDGDDDGLLDLSFVMRFDPLDQGVPGGATFDLVAADCTAPMSSTRCSMMAGAAATTFAYTNQSGASPCLAAVPGTTSGYDPALSVPTGLCFVSDEQTIDLNLGTIRISLRDAQVAAAYVGAPAGRLSNALLRGFLTLSDAMMINLPDDIPLLGGMPISSLLPGGPGNCKDESDMDTHPVHGRGWWMYLNGTATEVDYE